MGNGQDKAGRGAHPQRILILGGTTEASALAAGLAPLAAHFAPTLSLAGRTARPRPLPVPTRIGGFGGAQGLAEYLLAEGIGQVVDATHPFAARISRNAAEACAAADVPLLAIRRPAWDRQPRDDWTEVDDMAGAAAALGEMPRNVFLTIGRQEVSAFLAAPQHRYFVRSIEPAGVALPQLQAIAARGPFDRAAETRFLREAGIAVMVTKNSGGAATYAKIEAARDLGLPVVVVRRPAVPAVPWVADAQAALERLRQGIV